MYILLLTESWLTGKDASLPDNMGVLRTICRGEDVSMLVLRMFPIVETQWGNRRRNPTLYKEWKAATDRSQVARDYGCNGGHSRSEAKVQAARENGKLGGRPPKEETQLTQQTQAQANPTQTKPNQCNESDGHGSFKNISTHYASFFGVGHSRNKKHLEKYQQACARFGEDTVLNLFDRWAKSAEWLRERHDANGLNLFWKPLEDMAAGDDLARKRNIKPPERVYQLSERDPFAIEVDPDAPSPAFLEANKDRAF